MVASTIKNGNDSFQKKMSVYKREIGLADITCLILSRGPFTVENESQKCKLVLVLPIQAQSLCLFI